LGGAGINLSISSVIVAEGGHSYTYVIRLNTSPAAGESVTINVAFDSAQLSLSPTSRQLNNSNWNTGRNITITAVDDTLSETSPHTRVLSHSSTSSISGSVYNGLVGPNLTVNIIDNDPTPTATRTNTRTFTPTATATPTPTSTATATFTSTPTATPTPTPTPTPLAKSIILARIPVGQIETPTDTVTAEPTLTSTDTSTATPETATETWTATSTASETLTETPTVEAIVTSTSTETSTETATITATSTFAESTAELTPEAEFTEIVAYPSQGESVNPDGGLPSDDLLNGDYERTIYYTYDTLYQLTGVNYQETSQIGSVIVYETTRIYDYTYDLRGNRLTETEKIGESPRTTTEYTYDLANRLTQINGSSGTTTLQYDNNGNLLNDGVNTYTYNAADRLTQFTNGSADTITYAYNGVGNRYRQTVNGVQTDYLLDLNGMSQVLGEFTPGSETWYLMGMDVLGQQQNGSWSYFNHDGLGSVRQVTNANGDVTYAAGYEPYGSLLEYAGASNTPFGYAGEYTDSNDLINLRARYYNSDLGRFLTRDPFGGILTMPASLNGYSYVHGNPINLTDPSGRFPWLAIAAGAAIGAAISFAFDFGTQLVTNVSNGMNFGHAVRCAWNNVNWGNVAEGAVLGAIAGGVGGILRQVGIQGIRAAAITTATDFGLGVVADMVLRGTSFGEAVVNSVVAGIIGAGAGAAGNRIARSVVRSSQSVIRPITRGVTGQVDDLFRTVGRYVDDIARSVRGQCGFNSFSASTVVLTPDGYKAISELEVGDMVLAYNQATNEVVEETITAVHVHTDPVIIHLVIDGELIETTPEHPFFTRDEGWVAAENLDEGDAVMTAALDFGSVESVTVLDQPQTMYNLTVDDAHTFFVGTGDWLVHNCPPQLELEGMPAPIFPSRIQYLDLDNFDRATGANAILRLPFGGGTDASTRLYPRPYDRSHLIASRFGGSGSEQRNIVPLHYLVNQRMMKAVEARVEEMSSRNWDVIYTVSVQYGPELSIYPSSLSIVAESPHRLLSVTLANRAFSGQEIEDWIANLPFMMQDR
jgi:RHS repeat-associated protein